MKRTHVLLCILTALGVSASCAKRSNRKPASAQLDVLSQVPPPNSLAEPATAVSVSFAEDLDPLSIDASSLQVADEYGPLDGEVDYDTASRTLRWRPRFGLTLASTHVARLSAQVHALGGAELQQELVWDFQVRDGMWTTQEPLAGACELAMDRSGTTWALLDTGEIRSGTPGTWTNVPYAGPSQPNSISVDRDDVVRVCATLPNQEPASNTGGLTVFVTPVAPANRVHKLIATASNETVLTASASTAATPGSYEIEVEQLAAAQENAASYSSPTATIPNTSNPGSLRIGHDGMQYFVAVAPNLMEIATGINAADNSWDVGVRACVVDTGNTKTPSERYQLVLRAKDMGAANGFTVAYDDGGSGFEALIVELSTNQVTAPQDSIVKVDGLSSHRESNTIDDLFAGITIELMAVTTGTETVTIAVTTDLQSTTGDPEIVVQTACGNAGAKLIRDAFGHARISYTVTSISPAVADVTNGAIRRGGDGMGGDPWRELLPSLATDSNGLHLAMPDGDRIQRSDGTFLQLSQIVTPRQVVWIDAANRLLLLARDGGPVPFQLVAQRVLADGTVEPEVTFASTSGVETLLASTSGDAVLLVGAGLVANGNQSYQVYRLHPATGAWMSLPPLYGIPGNTSNGLRGLTASDHRGTLWLALDDQDAAGTAQLTIYRLRPADAQFEVVLTAPGHTLLDPNPAARVHLAVDDTGRASILSNVGLLRFQ